MCVGTLVGFDDVEDLYNIRYDGGDEEELSWIDFAKLLRFSGDTITAVGAVQPLRVEAATKMSQAAALQLQRNLLRKEDHYSSCATQRPTIDGGAGEEVATGQASTSGSDSMICGGTKISAHTSRRMENAHRVEVAHVTAAPVRKSPRDHVSRKALGDIAAQYAHYGSSDCESAMHTQAMGKKVNAGSIATSDSLSDSDAEYNFPHDHEEQDSCSTSDSDNQVTVSQTAKDKQPIPPKVYIYTNEPTYCQLSELWR
jgi:hypothetical protein